MIINFYKGNGGGGSGSQGPQGYQGPEGPQGTQGATGTQGPAGSGSSVDAYKIELSTTNPEDFTQDDIANLNAFWDALDADPSIIPGCYVIVDEEEIFRYTRGSMGNNGGEFNFERTTPEEIRQLYFYFEDDRFGYAEFQEKTFSSLKPVSEFPEDAETGEVVALSIPPGEGTWEVFDASEHPTKVRILTRDNGTYLLHFDNDNLFTGLDYTAGNPPTFNGWGWGLQPDNTYEWHYDNNGYYISVSAEEEDGDWYIYAEMTQGAGGFSMLDAYGLGGGSEMYSGGTEGSIGVYQYDGSDWSQIGNDGGEVDTEMSSGSTNAVQNRVIKSYVDTLVGDINTILQSI